MSVRSQKWVLFCLLSWMLSPVVQAGGEYDCNKPTPITTFIEFQSYDISQQPAAPLTIKGKLKQPVHINWKHRCFSAKSNQPAVVILHGSAGVDFRGDFYARALNAAGIATLEIDMWEARGISSAADRPAVPLFTYPDAFGALAYLSEHPNIDPTRIGIIGFSWGAVVTMASATNLYATMFGGGLQFAAHVAHYPVCWGYNNPGIPGSEFSDLTGSPLLIQIGEEDDYDNGSAPCFALKAGLDPDEQNLVEVKAYEGAYHAWDRLQVPIAVNDPFADQGSYLLCMALGGGDTCVIPEVEMIPDVEHAYASRKKVVRFFLQNL